MLSGVVAPVPVITPGPLSATQEELDIHQGEVGQSRDRVAEELRELIEERKSDEEHERALEEHLEEVRRWRFVSIRRGPGLEDNDDVDCSRPELGYLPYCYPECEPQDSRDTYSPGYIPECNPDCYWNWIGDNFVEGFSAAAEPACRPTWDPLNDCSSIKERLTVFDLHGFAQPPLTDAEMIQWLTCPNNPEYNRQPEPKPLDLSDICIDLSPELLALVEAFDRIDHQTWQREPQITPRGRDKQWNNQPQSDGSVDTLKKLKAEFRAVAVVIQGNHTMSFPETVDLVEVIVRYLEGDPTAVAAFEDLIPADMLEGYGNDVVAPLDAFVETWTMEALRAAGRGLGLPPSAAGPDSEIEENLVRGNVRNWPAVLRGMCAYRDELEQLDDVVDRVQQNTSTQFSVHAWHQNAAPATGTKVFFEVRNNSSVHDLNLSYFTTELVGWDSTDYVCNPTAGSDLDVGALTIGPNARVRCHLVLKAPRAFLAEDQPDAKKSDGEVINPNGPDIRRTGPFGSLTVNARSNGVDKRTLTSWGEALTFDIGESGTGTGTFQVHGVGPVPWGFELRAEDGLDNLNNSRFNWIRGEHDNWIIQADVTWNPRNRTSESFELVDVKHGQAGRSIWISIEYPGANDTILWPNVVEIDDFSNPRTSVQQSWQTSGVWMPGSTRFQIDGHDVEVGDIIVGGVDDEVFPEGAQHRVSWVNWQGWFELEDERVEMIDVFRQIDLDTTSGPAIKVIPVDADVTARVLDALASAPASRFDFVKSSVEIAGSFTTATTTRTLIEDFWRPELRESWTKTSYGVGGNVFVNMVATAGSNSTQVSALDKVSFQLYPLETTDPFYEVPKFNVPIWADPPIIMTVNPQVSVEFAFELTGGIETAFEFTSEGDWYTEYNAATGEWEGDYELSKWSEASDILDNGDLTWLSDQTNIGANSFMVEVGLEFEADVSIQPLWALVEGTVGFNPKIRIEGEREPGEDGTVEVFGVPGFELGAELLDGLNLLQRLLDEGSWAQTLYETLNGSPWVRQFFTPVIDLEADIVTLTAGRDAHLFYRSWEWPWGCNSPSCFVAPGSDQGQVIPLNEVSSTTYSVSFDIEAMDVSSIDVAVAIGTWSGVTNVWVEFADNTGRYLSQSEFESATWNNGADGRVVFEPPLDDVVGFTLFTDTGVFQSLEEIRVESPGGAIAPGQPDEGGTNGGTPTGPICTDASTEHTWPTSARIELSPARTVSALQVDTNKASTITHVRITSPSFKDWLYAGDDFTVDPSDASVINFTDTYAGVTRISVKAPTTAGFQPMTACTTGEGANGAGSPVGGVCDDLAVLARSDSQPRRSAPSSNALRRVVEEPSPIC